MSLVLSMAADWVKRHGAHAAAIDSERPVPSTTASNSILFVNSLYRSDTGADAVVVQSKTETDGPRRATRSDCWVSGAGRISGPGQCRAFDAEFPSLQKIAACLKFLSCSLCSCISAHSSRQSRHRPQWPRQLKRKPTRRPRPLLRRRPRPLRLQRQQLSLSPPRRSWQRPSNRWVSVLSCLHICILIMI